MAEVISLGPTLSDSTFKTRPNFKAYIQTDGNAGLDTIQLFENQRRARQMKFPSLSGNKIPNSLRESLNEQSFKKWNDEGDHRAPAPTRYYSNLIDPVSGFVSAGGDQTRQTGVKKLKNFVHVSDTPQDYNPQGRNSIRVVASAPGELHRENRFAPPAPSYWNSRKTLDISTRAKCGGWTSDVDPRELQSKENLGKSVEQLPAGVNKDVRDKLAMQYMYKSSTQRQYEDIPWDTMLPPKQWAPTTTLEPKPDQVDQRYQLKRYGNQAQEWQLAGKSWDWFQTRNGYYKNPQWVNFSSPCPRVQHIPLYGGCTGADNLDQVDDQTTKFNPYTIKRVNIPREAETSHRPNIPGYQGCTLYNTVRTSAPPDTDILQPNTPSEKSSTPKNQTTTSIVHGVLPQTASAQSEWKRDSLMSKMVTTVPPHNPFNKIDMMPQKLKV